VIPIPPDTRSARTIPGRITIVGAAGLLLLFALPAAAAGQSASADSSLGAGADLPPPENLAAQGERDRWLGAGERLERLGRLDEAADAYARAAEVSPRDATVIGRQAAVELRRGHAPRALALYREALVLRPGHLEFRVGLARAHAEVGDANAALATYRSILAERPGERRALLGSARVLGRAGRYDEAIRMYERYLTYFEESPDGLMGLARVYSWNNQFARSIQTYHRILSTDPKNREARLGLARVLSWQGDLQRADAMYREMLHDSPDDLVVLIDYAKLLAWTEQYTRSIDVYHRILEGDPENVEAMLGLSRVLAWQGDLEGSEKLYDRVLERDPQNREAVMGKIQVLYWGGSTRRAGEFLERHPPETVADPDYRRMAASIELQLGRPERALELVADPEESAVERDLLAQIRRVLEPSYRAEIGFAHDSEGRQITTLPHEFSFSLNPETRQRIRLLHASLAEENRAGVSRLDVSTGFSHRMGDRVEVSPEVGVSHYNPGYTTGIWALDWTYRPADGWEVGLGVNRKTFGWTARAIERGIVTTTLPLRLKHEWWRSWSLRLSLSPALYSDDNRRFDARLGLGHTFLKGAQRFDLSYEAHLLTFQWDRDNGYFDPGRYVQHGIVGSKRLDLGERGFVETRMETGHWSRDGGESSWLWKLDLLLSWEALEGLAFRFDLRLFSSALQFDTGAYGSAAYRLGLRYNL
jgi:tetratricopeptide (TPR) repeat protein